MNKKNYTLFLLLIVGMTSCTQKRPANVTATDSAQVADAPMRKAVNFSDEYIREHKGKTEVDMPEVHELVNIMVAISQTGQKDSNLVDMQTAYYKEVMQHFLPFSDHPSMDVINRRIVGVLDRESYAYYYALKMNACAYQFTDDGKIRHKGIIRKMGFQGQADPLVENRDLFADFAEASGFRLFYQNHRSYYDGLIAAYKQTVPLAKMIRWLEDRFGGFGYDNYTVYFSPLVRGAHSTTWFEDNGFKQSFMFINSIHIDPKYNENINIMRNLRVVFTEMDHDFVNPLSNKYYNIINQIFRDRNKWGDETRYYDNPYARFNEYMTWGLTSLYCYDHFPKKDVDDYMAILEKQMEQQRGFKLFSPFNRQLVKYYEGNPKIDINELYGKILDWSAKQ